MSEAAAALAGDNGSAEGTPTGAEGAQPSWSDGLNEDTVAFIENKGWVGENGADLSKMTESYHNLERFAGGSKDLVALPGADADEEALGKFYNALGRPESADQYGFEMPDDGDAELDGWFRQTAHKHGLSDAQAKGLYDEWNEMSGQRFDAIQQSLIDQGEADIKALQKEWGQGYDAQIDAGSRAARALGYDEAALSAMEEKLGTADMLKLMANIGSKMGEDSFETGDISGGFGTTPAQAKAQMADLRLDQGFMDKYLNGDKDAIAKMNRLMEAAYGS